MGLAMIREGDLGGGSREIEVAASLDPNNALVRSYLGKAYYEEKRDGRSTSASSASPSSSTRRTRRRGSTTRSPSRPPTARSRRSQSIEKAQELNDNRAVYRSHLLLDSDAARAAASQSRIYCELGFRQLALVEGWDSVNLDPTNFSAHRFLADSYSDAAAPRDRARERVAAVATAPAGEQHAAPAPPRGEQPVPDQLGRARRTPRSTSSTRCSTETARPGCSAASSGSRTPGRRRDRRRIQQGRLQCRLRSSRRTGFRPNNDQDDELANAFAQHEVTPQTSVQAEYRTATTRTGDLQLKFFEDDFSPGLRTRTPKRLRLGGRHTFSPNTIASALLCPPGRGSSTRYFDRPFGLLHHHIDIPQESTTAASSTAPVAVRPDSTCVSGVGAGKVEGSTRRLQHPDRSGPFGLIEESSTTEPERRPHNAYLYTDTRLSADATMTLGVSGDFFDEEEGIGHRDQEANPKAAHPSAGSADHGPRGRLPVVKRTLISGADARADPGRRLQPVLRRSVKARRRAATAPRSTRSSREISTVGPSSRGGTWMTFQVVSPIRSTRRRARWIGKRTSPEPTLLDADPLASPARGIYPASASTATRPLPPASRTSIFIAYRSASRSSIRAGSRRVSPRRTGSRRASSSSSPSRPASYRAATSSGSSTRR